MHMPAALAGYTVFNFPRPPVAEPLSYGYTPVYDAAPASIRQFGIDELNPQEHV